MRLAPRKNSYSKRKSGAITHSTRKQTNSPRPPRKKAAAASTTTQHPPTPRTSRTLQCVAGAKPLSPTQLDGYVKAAFASPVFKEQMQQLEAQHTRFAELLEESIKNQESMQAAMRNSLCDSLQNASGTPISSGALDSSGIANPAATRTGREAELNRMTVRDLKAICSQDQASYRGYYKKKKSALVSMILDAEFGS
jgi:hypothetical protein